MSNLKTVDVRLILAGVLGLIVIIAAYVTLVALGHGSEANGLAPLVVTLLGLFGLGAHNAQRLGQQDQQLAQITHQTNGVLTARIENATDAAVRNALRSAGYHVADHEPVAVPSQDPEVPAP